MFPSALPGNSGAGGQDKLGDLFAAFAGAGGNGLGAVSAKRKGGPQGKKNDFFI